MKKFRGKRRYFHFVKNVVNEFNLVNDKDSMVQVATDFEFSFLKNQFGRLDIENEEILEGLFSNIGILDVYDQCLTEEEAVKLLSSFKNHNLKYEKNFLLFFEKIFELNSGQPIFVQLSIPFSNKSFSNMKTVDLEEYKNVLEKDSFAFLHNLLKSNSNVFKVTSLQALQLISTLSTREVCFGNIFFPALETVIVGNFELSFPVYCNDNNIFYQLNQNAETVGLFIGK
ncbi:hypothetical protein [Bacillus sp. EAC]|uniref:hypothetical protein n=1 Tax=Bacillus sp. EAC TaxID=1978338 RepID=UPI000B439C70|nr:hypothetical protein [Bacillus sp. EAC]